MGWKVFARSAVGTGHVRRGTRCQDAHKVRQGPGGLVVAVADGAGSAQLSELGADLAALHASWVVERALAEGRAPSGELLAGAAEAARGELLLLARRIGERPGYERMAPGQLACTLIVVAATADTLAVGQVGDGTVVLRRGGGRLEAISTPRASEYVNETVFLTSDGWAGAFRYTAAPAADVDALAVMTDGLESVAINYRSRGPEPAFFAPIFDYAAAAAADDPFLEALLDRDEINERTNDDKTLVVATRAG